MATPFSAPISGPILVVADPAAPLEAAVQSVAPMAGPGFLQLQRTLVAEQTSTPLLANDAFIGAIIPCRFAADGSELLGPGEGLRYTTVMVTIRAVAVLGVGELQFWSCDASRAGFVFASVATVVTENLQTFVQRIPAGSFVLVKYINGAVDQSVFSLTTELLGFLVI